MKIWIPDSTCINLLWNMLHSELLIRHPLPVQLYPQQPGGYTGWIKVRHLVVHIDKLLILGNHSVLGIRVVVDSSVSGYLDIQKSQPVLESHFILMLIRTLNLFNKNVSGSRLWMFPSPPQKSSIICKWYLLNACTMYVHLKYMFCEELVFMRGFAWYITINPDLESWIVADLMDTDPKHYIKKLHTSKTKRGKLTLIIVSSLPF